jgi:hypothetical protein
MASGIIAYFRALRVVELIFSRVLSDRAVHPSTARSAKAWGLSLEEWLAYEREMENQDDYARWIAEMEGEASDAVKQPAGLNTSSAPF